MSGALRITISIDAPDFLGLSPIQRATMRAVGQKVFECYRVLEKAGLNVVGEVLKVQGDFVEMEHYPRDDVFDAETHGQYYYHAHRGGDVEHGHFHTFLRAGGMPAGVAPLEICRHPSLGRKVTTPSAISSPRHGRLGRSHRFVLRQSLGDG